jgi:hypothetical protein
LFSGFCFFILSCQISLQAPAPSSCLDSLVMKFRYSSWLQFFRLLGFCYWQKVTKRAAGLYSTISMKVLQSQLCYNNGNFVFYHHRWTEESPKQVPAFCNPLKEQTTFESQPSTVGPLGTIQPCLQMRKLHWSKTNPLNHGSKTILCNQRRSKLS